MLASHFIAASAAIVFAMGTGHLILGLFTNVFAPRDADLWERMKTASPRFSTHLKMWRSLVGFHGSHSFGPMIFGAVWGYFALSQPEFLFHSAYFLWLGLAILIAYIILAVLYWFYLPLVGLLLSTSCYAAGIWLGLPHSG